MLSQAETGSILLAYSNILQQEQIEQKLILKGLVDIQSEISNLQFSENVPQDQICSSFDSIDKRLSEIEKQVDAKVRSDLSFPSTLREVMEEYLKAECMMKLKRSDICTDFVIQGLRVLDALMDSDTKSEWKKDSEETLSVSVDFYLEVNETLKSVKDRSEANNVLLNKEDPIVKKFPKEIAALEEKLLEVERLTRKCSLAALEYDLFEEKQKSKSKSNLSL